MTQIELARAYLRLVEDRLEALGVFRERRSYANLRRESQEIVELVLKAALRGLGIDPPRVHEVGRLLERELDALPEDLRAEAGTLVGASREPRKDREMSFYGEIDSVPTECFSAAEGEEAYRWAALAVSWLKRFLAGRSSEPGSSTTGGGHEE
ncbi:HEPN domain-containing protein [Verrucomicrobium sp. 3C]|uniref:HEPN domain-containing protein n=1 Tax=Verrucomicrobium sp. 3C TaxID=1134055 RepID=UPI00036F556F|nr:HEPN domain-containing protein [Verrucomicrobium sp. 3C]